MKILIKNLIYKALSFFSFRGATILMYHSIGNNTEFFTVSPNEFERQMKYLRENKFNVISLTKLLNYLKAGTQIPPKTVIITFDDGYSDNYSNAFPILKKYDFPATIFLTTGLIGKEKVSRQGNKFQILNWERVKEMHCSGLIDFEPHTVSHPKLSKLDFKEAEKEILESKQVIEKKLNKKCNFFAYPYGDYDQKTIDFVKENFDLALTIENGRINLHSNLFKLNRNSIDSRVNFTQFKGVVKFGRI